MKRSTGEGGGTRFVSPSPPRFFLSPHVEVGPVSIIAGVKPGLGNTKPRPFPGLIHPGRQVPGVQPVHAVPIILAQGETDGVWSAINDILEIEVIEIHGQTQAVVGYGDVTAVVDLRHVLVVARDDTGIQGATLLVRKA